MSTQANRHRFLKSARVALALLVCLGAANLVEAQITYTIVDDRNDEWKQTFTLPTFADDSRLRTGCIIGSG